MKGKTEIQKKEKVEKIDNIPPVIKKVELVTPWTMDYTQQVNMILTDAHSGVGGYCFKTTTSKPSPDDSCFKTVRFPAYGGVGSITDFLPAGKYYIFAKDRVGNVGGYNSDNPNDPNNKNLTFEVKDETPPVCSISASGKLGNNNWYVDDVTIVLSTSDAHSGVKTYDLTKSSSSSYNNKTKLTQTQDTNGTTYYGYVEDRAGNTSRCQLTIKKDATNPTCNLSSSGTMGKNNWYIGDVKISMVTDDNLSGVKTYELNDTGNQPSSNSFNKRTSMTLNTDTNAKQYYGFVEDNAGNKGKCQFEGSGIKRDTQKPTCTLKVTGNKKISTSKWYTGDVTISWDKKGDTTSQIVSYGITESNTKNYNKQESALQKEDVEDKIYYGFVKDEAGWESTCEIKVSKDTVSPTCSISSKSNGQNYNGEWTNNQVSVIATCADSKHSTVNSGCVKTQSSFTTNIQSGNNYNKSNVGAAGENTKVTFSDQAGNTVDCPNNQSIKIDRKAPTCTVTGGSDEWTNGSRHIIATCSDTGGSGCTQSKIDNGPYTREQNVTNAGAVNVGQGGSFSDNAGNVVNCPANQTVRIDKTAPTITRFNDYTVPPYTGDNNEQWTGLRYGYNIYDTGGSGINPSTSMAQSQRYYNEEDCSYGVQNWGYNRTIPPAGGSLIWKSGCGDFNRRVDFWARICDYAGNCAERTETTYTNQGP